MFLGDASGGMELEGIHSMSVQGDPYAGLFEQDLVEDGDLLPKAWVFFTNIPVKEFRVLKLDPQVPDPEVRLVPSGCAEFE